MKNNLNDKEARTAYNLLAKKWVQCIIEALYPACGGFSAGRQFSLSKSASAPSAKTLLQV